jgi:hypothetical protein
MSVVFVSSPIPAVRIKVIGFDRCKCLARNIVIVYFTEYIIATVQVLRICKKLYFTIYSTKHKELAGCLLQDAKNKAEFVARKEE